MVDVVGDGEDDVAGDPSPPAAAAAFEGTATEDREGTSNEKKKKRGPYMARQSRKRTTDPKKKKKTKTFAEELLVGFDVFVLYSTRVEHDFVPGPQEEEGPFFQSEGAQEGAEDPEDSKDSEAAIVGFVPVARRCLRKPLQPQDDEQQEVIGVRNLELCRKSSLFVYRGAIVSHHKYCT